MPACSDGDKVGMVIFTSLQSGALVQGHSEKIYFKCGTLFATVQRGQDVREATQAGRRTSVASDLQRSFPMRGDGAAACVNERGGKVVLVYEYGRRS
ncbi:uncharacterized protein MEPE_06559 [Melanopsichium pennsylvanicum]|uniref:Uncharacterized protein n=1 Tax=Melanopsichium pennsylvanicum TaxID=63383 RepID=A0AAJ4XUE4_9BASI|nr:uncharacterized protein MEPE_06559 [Melanopsichium pennsylvanicum]